MSEVLVFDVNGKKVHGVKALNDRIQSIVSATLNGETPGKGLPMPATICKVVQNYSEHITAETAAAIQKLEEIRSFPVQYCTLESVLDGIVFVGDSDQPTQPATNEPVKEHPRQFDADVAKKYAEKFTNAIKRGIEFDLSFTDMKALMRQKHCFYTGVPLVFGPDSTGAQQSNQFTIERLDNTKGYVKGNVVACSFIANQWKSIVVEQNKLGLSVDEMISILQRSKAV